ncbi:MAG: GTP cyclohydrolase II [Bacteriovoracaceae bacterium]
MEEYKKSPHIILATHHKQIYNESISLDWGSKDPKTRGPIVGTLNSREHRNVIGTHSGSYTVYRALSMAQGNYDKYHTPDLKNTQGSFKIGPHPSWYDPEKIISIDPWGAQVVDHFNDLIGKGINIQPSIAVTEAHLDIPELKKSVEEGRLSKDGKIVKEDGLIKCSKVAIEPVWYLPGIAKRFGIEEGHLRKVLFEETGGMFPELVTRHDLKVLLPPIGSSTAYIFGDPKDLSNKNVTLSCRVHDECNGSDVFGSDICTCRPYLTYGLEEAVKRAQNGGVGLVVYFRKEGRALGEVTKFLVYNARKKQPGGDTAKNYFYRTECVAGVEDARFQEFMPDVLHWFGVQKIHHFMSMSDMKHDAIVNSGIEIENRVTIPNDLIPEDAMVEIEAKKARGYFNEDETERDDKYLEKVKGRKFE